MSFKATTQRLPAHLMCAARSHGVYMLPRCCGSAQYHSTSNMPYVEEHLSRHTLSPLVGTRMRSLTSLFRTAPSAEFARTEHHGIQRVWKRLFEQLIDRADVYKRTGYNNMHDVNKELDEDVYLDLRVTHDA